MANSMADDATGVYTGGIPLNVTLHAWPVPKMEEKSKSFNDTGSGTVRISESAKNYTNSLHNLNATGYVAIDDDLTDTGFTDVQTFILAGIATLIPLLVVVATILGIRFVWRRYRSRKEEGYEGVLQKEESSEPLGKLQGYSLPQELKTSESQFTVTPGEEPTATSSPQLPTPKSNGSIITMTLKNNHLIVETEETVNTPATLKIESKGTTTKFVTPAGTDFRIVTVAETGSGFGEKSCKSVLSTGDHGALVHSPPEETEDELDKGSCNTGLSQSDLSISSTESQNPSYRYGNQMGYDSGGYGYAEYSGYAMNAQKPSRPPLTGGKEHKNYFRSSSMMDNTDPVSGEQVEAPFKNVLMSDIQAHEKKVEEDKEKRYQEEQRILGNGNSSNKSEEEEEEEEVSNCPKFKSEKVNYLSNNNANVNASLNDES